MIVYMNQKSSFLTILDARMRNASISTRFKNGYFSIHHYLISSCLRWLFSLIKEMKWLINATETVKQLNDDVIKNAFQKEFKPSTPSLYAGFMITPKKLSQSKLYNLGKKTSLL